MAVQVAAQFAPLQLLQNLKMGQALLNTVLQWFSTSMASADCLMALPRDTCAHYDVPNQLQVICGTGDCSTYYLNISSRCVPSASWNIRQLIKYNTDAAH